MSIKKNTLGTITPNKARRIYRKELAGMSKIWPESSGEWVGSGVFQLVYKPQSKALGAYHLGQAPFSKSRRLTQASRKSGQDNYSWEPWSFFLTFLSETPTPCSLPTPFTSSSSSCHGAWDSCSGVHHHTLHIVLWKMQRCLGKGYITSLRP